MAKNQKTNSYDVSRDLIIAKPMVLHIDDATGAQVGAPGEGVSSFAVCLRSMKGEDGTSGPLRIAVQTAFVSKGSANAQPRWTLDATGTPSLQAHPPAGSLCVAAAAGRESPHVAATLYAAVSAYAAKVGAALARKAQKAA